MSKAPYGVEMAPAMPVAQQKQRVEHCGYPVFSSEGTNRWPKLTA